VEVLGIKCLELEKKITGEQLALTVNPELLAQVAALQKQTPEYMRGNRKKRHKCKPMPFFHLLIQH